MVGRLDRLMSCGRVSSEDIDKFVDAKMKAENPDLIADDGKKDKKSKSAKKHAGKETFVSIEKTEETEYEKKMDELKKKIIDLTEKNQKISKEKQYLALKRDEAQQNYEAEKNRREVAEGKAVKLKTDYDRLMKDYSKLKEGTSENESALLDSKDRTINDLKSEKKKLDDKIRDIIAEKDDAYRQMEKLKSKIKELEFETESLKESVEKSKSVLSIDLSNSDYCVERTSSNEFKSSLFTLPRYKVTLSKDYSSLSFKPDVMGKAVCINNTIFLLGLEDSIPFNGSVKYLADMSEGGKITVQLRQY